MSSSQDVKPGRPTDLAKREAILRTAGRSFFDAGFAATSIEQVAADAGLSKVTVYNHFGDKRGLFTAAVDFVERVAHEHLGGEQAAVIGIGEGIQAG